MNNEQNVNFDPATEKPIKHYPPFEKGDRIAFAVFALLALLFANFWFIGGLRLGFTIGGLSLLSASLVYLKARIRYTPLSVVCLISAVAALISFSIYTNFNFEPFKFLFLIFSVSLFYVSACGIKAPSLTDFRALLAPFYLFFGVSCTSIGDTVGAMGQKKNGKGKQFLMALIAILCVFPVFILLAALLASADAAFADFVDGIHLDFGEGFATLFLGSFLLLFGFPLVFALAKKNEKLKASERAPYLSVLNQTFANTFLFVIAFLYLVFFATQFSYLVGGFSGVRPEEYTFAEYARRGFGEMCAICVINLILLFLSEMLTKRTDGKLPLITRILHIFICSASLFFVLSSFAKMFLYIRTYGLTVLRLGTSIFMLFLFFVFTAIILHTLRPTFGYIRLIVVALCVIMTVFSLADPNMLIVRFNTAAYESGMHQNLDMDYLADCGDAAVPTLIAYANGEDETLSEAARTALLHGARYSFLNDHFSVFPFSDYDKTEPELAEYDFRSYAYTYAKAHTMLAEYDFGLKK